MTTFEGTWYYRSFLILPTPSEEEAPPGSAITTRKWAMGTLTVPTGADLEVSGELAFATGAALVVKGHILPASDLSPAIFVATGEGLSGPTKGSIYQITGAFFNDANGQQFIYGSTLGARGPDTQPDMAGGMPINTVGTFVLSRQVAGK